MKEVFFVPTAIAMAVSFAGLLWWLVAFLGGYGIAMECVFIGIGIGGLVSAVAIGLAEPIEAQGENGE